jgi:hypothetical protein
MRTLVSIAAVTSTPKCMGKGRPKMSACPEAFQ